MNSSENFITLKELKNAQNQIIFNKDEKVEIIDGESIGISSIVKINKSGKWLFINKSKIDESVKKIEE